MTHATPATESTPPMTCRGLIRSPKNSAPTARMKTGPAEPIKVVLFGLEVRKAQYWKELNDPTPSIARAKSPPRCPRMMPRNR